MLYKGAMGRDGAGKGVMRTVQMSFFSILGFRRRPVLGRFQFVFQKSEETGEFGRLRDLSVI